MTTYTIIMRRLVYETHQVSVQAGSESEARTLVRRYAKAERDWTRQSTTPLGLDVVGRVPVQPSDRVSSPENPAARASELGTTPNAKAEEA